MAVAQLQLSKSQTNTTTTPWKKGDHQVVLHQEGGNKSEEEHEVALSCHQHKKDEGFVYPSLNATMETEIVEFEHPLVREQGDVEEELLNERRQTRSQRIRTVVGLFLLAFIIFVISDALTNKYIRTGMQDFLDWVEDNPASGVVAFIMVVFGTTMLFIPGIILTFGSGYVFANAFGLGVGVLVGIVAVFVGASSGSLVSFLIGRFLLRDCVVRLTKKFKTFEALDKAMEAKGLRIMLLLRFSPIIFASPYLNYGAGGTAISFRAYTISLLAILPACAMFVFLGASARSLTDSSSGSGDSKAGSITLLVGIVFSVFAIALTSWYVRQELRKITDPATTDEQLNSTVNEEVNDEERGRSKSPHASP